MKKHYYAMQWRFNTVYANSALLCVDYYKFHSCSARRAWLENGNPLPCRGFREKIASSDAGLRRALRHKNADALIELIA